ncbi:SpoIID/LytB domain-containing protein [Cytobacillus gottheilii]|uniref:SpoIID/LytB domain-containing protein n=1 Tax=Cytobacillus gottheilii TaxID=859144 RepID=UPI0009B9742A|nr:SpoIID/LytB domain-containing protein [Cytobacillus gottheilii]
MLRKMIGLTFLLTLFIAASNLLPSASAISTEPLLKVKLQNTLGNKEAITIIPAGDYAATDGNETYILTDQHHYSLKIASDNNICLWSGSTKLQCSETITLSPMNKDHYLSIQNTPYNGSFEIKQENNFVRPYNFIYMEDYIKGVVPKEIYASWPTEALKVQATAARSYAAFRESNTIVDGVSNQVYGGYFWSPDIDRNGIYKNSNLAVDATKGKIITSNGKIIDAVYSSSNGGYTESNSNEWGSTQLPYLLSKRDEFDGLDSRILWSISLQTQQIDLRDLDLSNPESWWDQVTEADATAAEKIKELLNKPDENLKIVAIKELDIHTVTSGQRVEKADIPVEYISENQVDSDGNILVKETVIEDVTRGSLRSILGSKMLSYYIKKVDHNDQTITVSGAGFGHGVGLSQHGAKNRALDNQDYMDIINFYYTGTLVTDRYTQLADRSSQEAQLEGWVVSDQGRSFYDENGNQVLGWKQIDQVWYYFTNKAAATGWNYAGGKWYYHDVNGQMKVGWVKDKGTWYYLNSSGAMQTGWLNDRGTWYYLNSSGAMKAGWLKDGSSWYFLNASGAMQTGWLKDQNQWYYLYSSGKMATGWLKDGTKWYYLNSSGEMQKGWLKSGSSWYYLSASGAMSTGWISTGGQWYYLYSDGRMAANTTIQGYRLGHDGAWIQ